MVNGLGSTVVSNFVTSVGDMVQNRVSHVVRLALVVRWSRMNRLMSLLLVDWVLDVANRGVSLLRLVANVWALNVMRLWGFVMHWSGVMHWCSMVDRRFVVDWRSVVWRSLVVDWNSVLWCLVMHWNVVFN